MCRDITIMVIKFLTLTFQLRIFRHTEREIIKTKSIHFDVDQCDMKKLRKKIKR